MNEHLSPKSLLAINALPTDLLLGLTHNGNEAFERVQDALLYADRPADDELALIYTGLAAAVVINERWLPTDETAEQAASKKTLSRLLLEMRSSEDTVWVKDFYGSYDVDHVKITTPDTPNVSTQIITHDSANRIPVDTPVRSPLMETDSNDFSPEAFVALITESLHSFDFEDQAMLRPIITFIEQSQVTFIEPPTPEAELSSFTVRAEREISGFIESNQRLACLTLVNKKDVINLCEIYNPNNMLAFAKDIFERSRGNIPENDLDMIFRYRTVLKQLSNILENIHAAQEELETSKVDTKVGHRTWAGDLREYGHITHRIDTSDLRNFSEQEDQGTNIIHIQGEEVHVDRIADA